MSAKHAAAEARRLAYAADPAASLARAVKARKDRRVGCRPAPDTMAWLSALLPVEQAVACLAALRHGSDTAKAAGDKRTRGQVEADLLVERLTGQTEADQVPLEVQLMVPAGQPARPRPHRARDHPRPRTPARRPDRRPDRQSRPLRPVAPPVHPRQRGHRRRPHRSPLHRLARSSSSGSATRTPAGALLHRPDPPHRPHPALARRRPHHLRPRPRALRTRQPRPRTPRLESHHHQRRHRRPTPGRHDHANRPHLLQPRPQPALRLRARSGGVEELAESELQAFSTGSSGPSGRHRQRYAGHLLQSMPQHRSIDLGQQITTDRNLEVGTHPEQVLIERRVMNLAQRESVGHDRQPQLVPVADYVACIQERNVSKATHRTPACVSLEDPGAEQRLVETLARDGAEYRRVSSSSRLGRSIGSGAVNRRERRRTATWARSSPMR